jgi:hypothetical protein
MLLALASWGWFHSDNIRAMLPLPNGAADQDRSAVSCSHAQECPLFPLLNASLRSWRDHYCDSDAGWNNCARYNLSLTGRRVPITLLPNGHSAAHLARVSVTEGSCAAPPTQAPPRAPAYPPVSVSSRPADRGSLFQQALVPPAPRQLGPLTPTRPPQTPPSAQVARPAPQAPDPTGNWWTRLVDWMKTPA